MYFLDPVQDLVEEFHSLMLLHATRTHNVIEQLATWCSVVYMCVYVFIFTLDTNLQQ